MSGRAKRHLVRQPREPELIAGARSLALPGGRIEMWRNTSGGLDIRVVQYRFIDGGPACAIEAVGILAASRDSVRSNYLRRWERWCCRMVRMWWNLRPLISWFVYANGLVNIGRILRAVM